MAVTVTVSLWAWLLLALGPGVVGVVLIGYWDEVRTRRRVERERDHARRDAHVAQRLLASERQMAELMRPPARPAIDAGPQTPGGRDLPPREAVVLMPDGVFALDAPAVLADVPGLAERRASQPAELERAQPLPAPALDPRELIATAAPVAPGTLPDPLEVAAAHGQVRQRMEPPPWASAYDVEPTPEEAEPPRPNPLRPAVDALAEEPAPESQPEPERRDDEPRPPAGGRALMPFADPTETLVGGPVVPRYVWNPVPHRPAGQLPFVLPRDLMRRTGRRAVAYLRPPIRIWYRYWAGRALVSQLRSDLDAWVGSWPVPGRHREVAS